MTDSDHTSRRVSARAAFCPSCGTGAAPAWRFCAACGNELPDLPEQVFPPEAPTPVVEDDLVVQDDIAVEDDPVVEDDLVVEDEIELELDAPEAEPREDEDGFDFEWFDTLDWPEDNDDQADADDQTDAAVGAVSVFHESFAPAAESAPEVEVPVAGSSASAVANTARRAQLALLVSGAFGVAMVVSLFVLNRRIDSGASPDSVRAAEDLAELLWQPLFLVATAVALVLMVAWARSLRGVRPDLGAGPSRWSAAIATWGWAIPGANLVLGPGVLDDAEAAASSENTPRTHRSVVWGWALLCAVGAGAAVASAVSAPDTVAGSLDANSWSALGYGLLAAGYLVLVVAISGVTHVTLAALHEREAGGANEPRPDLLTSIAGVDRPHLAPELAEVEAV